MVHEGGCQQVTRLDLIIRKDLKSFFKPGVFKTNTFVFLSQSPKEIAYHAAVTGQDRPTCECLGKSEPRQQPLKDGDVVCLRPAIAVRAGPAVFQMRLIEGELDTFMMMQPTQTSGCNGL